MVLPVYCCCNPDRRIGWAYLPRAVREPQRLFFFTSRGSSLRDVFGKVDDAQRIDTEIEWRISQVRPRELVQCWRHGNPYYTVPVFKRELAIKSGDVDVEVWKRVPGFIADPRA